MKIGGLRKLTLLDYPQKVACTVFTAGCNFRCPFCHNAQLVTKKPSENYTEDEILSFLKERRGKLDGVCITGGEPLLQEDVEDFIRRVKAEDFSVKLDTNGSFPKKLKELIDKKLIDFVAMDIKNSLDRYGETVGIKDFDTARVEESADMLMKGGIPFEFRTTVVGQFHNNESFEKIGKRFAGEENYFLQKFVDSGDIIGEGLCAASDEDMEKYLETLKKYIPKAQIRG